MKSFGRALLVVGLLIPVACTGSVARQPATTETSADLIAPTTAGSPTTVDPSTTEAPSTTAASTTSSTAPPTTLPPIVGTPFGTFSSLDNVDETFERFSANRFVFGSPEEAIQYLDQARATRTRLFFSLVQKKDMIDDSGRFDPERFTAGLDRFADVDFAPYVADGTILGHYMIDEPKSPGPWGGQVVSNRLLDEIAAYSKSLWPTVPTAVRNPPARLIDHAEGLDTPAERIPRWDYLDIAWIQYNAALHGPIDPYVDAQVAAAEAQDLDIVVGIQALAGGEGESGLVPGSPFAPRFWIMSYDEAVRYGTNLLERRIGCAFISFRWDRNEETYFAEGTEIERAHTELQRLARNYEPANCRAR